MTAWQSSTSDRIGTLERDHRTLRVAFEAAFVFTIVMLAAGYLSLSAKLDAGLDRIGTKMDTLAAAVGEVRTDVAVLKTDFAALKTDVAAVKSDAS